MKNKLKIALIMQGGQIWIGGVEYIKNLILALGSLPEDVRSTFEIYLIANGNLSEDLRQQLTPYVAKFYGATDLDCLNFVSRLRCSLERRFLKLSNPELGTFLQRQDWDFVYPYDSCKPLNYRSAAWIPDFQHKYLPQFCTDQEIQLRDRIHTTIAKKCEIVVLSSQTAAADFKKFFPDGTNKVRVLSFKTVPSQTWYEGNSLEIQHTYNLPDHFFLVSNQFWQHKNHTMVFEALKLLKHRGVKPIVVCTGHIYDYRKPEYSDYILGKIHQDGLANQVFLLGLIPKLNQIQLMRQSLAVIQPSLFEGWSTLVEDARLLGKPMILSDLAVNQEQNPPYSLFFDRNSPESLAKCIEDLWIKKEPGPNPEAEDRALKDSQAAVQAYGHSFLKIAQGGVS
jgi:glycosyltransferase involved in cell wall biosynthesis